MGLPPCICFGWTWYGCILASSAPHKFLSNSWHSLPFFSVSIFGVDLAGYSSSSQTHWPVDCKFSILNPRGLTVYLVYLDIPSRSKTLRMIFFQYIVCFECSRPAFVVVWQSLAFRRFLRLRGCHLASIVGGTNRTVFLHPQHLKWFLWIGVPNVQHLNLIHHLCSQPWSCSNLFYCS